MAPCSACMQAEKSRGKHLLHEGDGVDGPPLQDSFPLVHRQLGKGLHGRAHGQQHPWRGHSRCARPTFEQEEQPAGQRHGSTHSKQGFTESLARACMGRQGPAHHQKHPWQAPCFRDAFTPPGLQHMYALLKTTRLRCAMAAISWAQKVNRGMLACSHEHAQGKPWHTYKVCCIKRQHRMALLCRYAKSVLWLPSQSPSSCRL